jgi:hypothetical protein
VATPTDTTILVAGSTVSDAVTVIGPAFVSLFGVFGGGNVTVQRESADGVWYPLADADGLTTNTDLEIKFPPGSTNRLRLSAISVTGVNFIVQGSGVL